MLTPGIFVNDIWFHSLGVKLSFLHFFIELRYELIIGGISSLILDWLIVSRLGSGLVSGLVSGLGSGLVSRLGSGICTTGLSKIIWLIIGLKKSAISLFILSLILSIHWTGFWLEIN